MREDGPTRAAPSVALCTVVCLASAQVFGAGTRGTGLDLEFADFDGDGRLDFYLASRGTPDRLLLRR